VFFLIYRKFLQKRKKDCNTKWCYSPYYFCTLKYFAAFLINPSESLPIPSRSSGSGLIAIVCLPITVGYSDILDDTLPLQRRYRAGFTPASLLAHTVVWEHEISYYVVLDIYLSFIITLKPLFVKGNHLDISILFTAFPLHATADDSPSAFP